MYIKKAIQFLLKIIKKKSKMQFNELMHIVSIHGWPSTGVYLPLDQIHPFFQYEYL